MQQRISSISPLLAIRNEIKKEEKNYPIYNIPNWKKNRCIITSNNCLQLRNSSLRFSPDIIIKLPVSPLVLSALETIDETLRHSGNWIFTITNGVIQFNGCNGICNKEMEKLALLTLICRIGGRGKLLHATENLVESARVRTLITLLLFVFQILA